MARLSYGRVAVVVWAPMALPSTVHKHGEKIAPVRLGEVNVGAQIWSVGILAGMISLRAMEPVGFLP